MSAKNHDAQSIASEPAALASAVRRIAESIHADPRTARLNAVFLPDQAAVNQILNGLFPLLFPGFHGPRKLDHSTLNQHVDTIVRVAANELTEQVASALRYRRELDPADSTYEAHGRECEHQARVIVSQFMQSIPALRDLLSLDVQAALDGDPAARHTDEVILCYPGLRALAVYRLAHILYELDVPLIPRMMSESAHSMTGIDIHPGARIGRACFIDHGTGVVIGETSIIGDHCRIYQGVTLGAKSFPRNEEGDYLRTIKRHPTLEDHVVVYANATILGGDTIVGAGCVINGGVFVTTSIPPGHVVRAAKLDVTIRSNPEMPPPNYAI
ncbi:MAG TPA: hypothetical protein VG711_00500 [Phycisphaerales bacterium]|nr:hypothetical protein [Phycisphaerales bacterium]